MLSAPPLNRDVMPPSRTTPPLVIRKQVSIMRAMTSCACLVAIVSTINAQPPPVIDMHLHALAADDQGPPPLGICTPIASFPAWDPTDGAALVNALKNPPCDDPVWSPLTDEALMSETLKVMQRRNVFGVLSGDSERVASWMAAGPERFFP